MKLFFDPKIENNVVKMTITVESLGTSGMTAEDEALLLSDFPAIIEYKNLTFSKKLNLNASNDVIEDNTTGEVIMVSVINKKIPVDANFKAEFILNINDIATTSLLTIFNTKEKLGRAMSECFRLTIVDALKTVLADMRAKKSDYEVTNTEII